MTEPDESKHRELVPNPESRLARRSNKLAERGLADLARLDQETALAKPLHPKELSLDLGNGVKLDLVLIPAGTFMMGDVVCNATLDDWDVEMPHSVTITKPFYIGKFTVTQEQYQEVIGQNPSRFKGNAHPVEFVSWFQAQDFCKKLTTQTKKIVRLPSEAEWEYSCRAGATTIYYSGDSEADLARVGWYNENCFDEKSRWTTHPVGQKEANKFGLFDMHGNVLEWCQDWYESYNKKYENKNSALPDYRVFRGGSIHSEPNACRSASRNCDDPEYSDLDIGFRVVVDIA